MSFSKLLFLHCSRRRLLTAALFIAGAQIASAQSLPKNFVLHAAPKSVTPITFEDGHGRSRSLTEFRGKILILNIWATWCGPCRHEMPSLDRLQKKLGGSEFEVIALSIDRAGRELVRKFYADIGIRNLAIYVDSSGKATRELATIGVPATLLIDRNGREVGRLVGSAEWDEPDILQLLKRLIAQKTGFAAPKTAPNRFSLARSGGTA